VQRKESRRPARSVLEAGLRAHGGNLTRLAGALGVSRPTLYKWIYQLDLATLAGVAVVYAMNGKNTRMYVKPAESEGRSLSGMEHDATVSDPRVSTNVRIRDGVWRALRKLAIDKGTSASELLEQAAVEFLRKSRESQQ
jgi:transposase-like protein